MKNSTRTRLNIGQVKLYFLFSPSLGLRQESQTGNHGLSLAFIPILFGPRSWLAQHLNNFGISYSLFQSKENTLILLLGKA